MKKRIIVKVCELCENPFQRRLEYTCSICKKKICSNCEVSEHFQHRADVCRVCAQNDKVKEIMQRYNDKHWKLVYDEQRALAKVKIKER